MSTLNRRTVLKNASTGIAALSALSLAASSSGDEPKKPIDFYRETTEKIIGRSLREFKLTCESYFQISSPLSTERTKWPELFW